MESLKDILNEIIKYTNIKSLKHNYEFINSNISGYKAYEKDSKVIVEYSDFHFVLKAVMEYESGIIKLPYENDLEFERFGIMLDCARNAVPSIAGLKRTIVLLSIFGYGYLGLYLEDCFEVDDEPYFGYNRGRYTKDELKEIVEYGNTFGIEIIPHIQTLAHLRQIFNNWDPYYRDCRDTNDILLMGSERTYQLIENMVKTCRECFTTDKIHIGMDEAFMMTYGRYRFDNKDYDRKDIFLRHAKRVTEICKKYDFKPEAWGDMFKAELTKETMFDSLSLTLWDYSGTDKEYYIRQFESYKELTDNLSFASGAHKWYGFAPLNELSEFGITASLEALKGKVKDFLITTWGDDGGECSYHMMWYSFIIGANLGYKNNHSKESLSKLSEHVTGYSLEELLLLDSPNKVFDCPMKKPVNPSKYVLYSDIFYGIGDRQENPKWNEYYIRSISKLESVIEKDGIFKDKFILMRDLIKVLLLKNNSRNELRKAYKDQDLEKIKEISIRLKDIVSAIDAFYESEKTIWHNDNKPQGFEIMDIRLGGLKQRTIYSKNILDDYIKGITKNIYLLEYNDLSPALSNDEYNDALCFNNFEQNATQGTLVWKNSQ